MLARCKSDFLNSFYSTQSSVRAPNLADSLSQYSKHSDDLSNKGIRTIYIPSYYIIERKTEKFVKT
jgi:hypothetical protein